jgi:hypothetical protein
MTCPPGALLNTTVLATYLDGVPVYTDGDWPDH